MIALNYQQIHPKLITGSSHTYFSYSIHTVNWQCCRILHDYFNNNKLFVQCNPTHMPGINWTLHVLPIHSTHATQEPLICEHQHMYVY